MSTEIPAVTKLYDIILWMMPQVEKFPRDFKFTVGDRIINLLLDSLELIIEAAYTKDKQQPLRKCNLQIEKLRFFIRMAKDKKYLSINKYAFISKEINELGKMIGGWLRVQGGKDIQKPLV
ncbi:MAG: diversity-generating retroelement protein Avd [Nitrospinae bacterium]|nr:diversity-generating retroelement protein Avd [Nitrospinota bacterium]